MSWSFSLGHESYWLLLRPTGARPAGAALCTKLEAARALKRLLAGAPDHDTTLASVAAALAPSQRRAHTDARDRQAALQAAVAGGRVELWRVAHPLPHAAGREAPPPEAPPPLEERPQVTWIEIVLEDAQGRPVKGADYVLELPGGKKREGKLDDHGKARLEGIDPGTCKVFFPQYDRGAWDRSSEDP